MGGISNTEIAFKYKVSKPTVTNWIRDAREKKNNLILIENDKKVQVQDNEHNHNELLRLSGEGRKYRRNTAHADITPSPEFYQIFDEQEIIEINRDLEIDREINFKFTYKNGGAEYWDKFYNKSVFDNSYKVPQRVKNLLKSSTDLILKRIPKSHKVNIVDIGIGNSDPVKEFLEHLDALGILNKYIAIDISPEMLDISKKNIQKWLPDLHFESYACDVENTKFLNIFTKIKFAHPNTVNIVLALGGTISNHENKNEVLNNISDGLGINDIFILSNGTNESNNKSALNHHKADEIKNQALWVPAMLGFNTNNLETINKFDEQKGCKVKSIFLDKDYVLKIQKIGFSEPIEFKKGEEIVLWRHYMTNPDTLFVDLSQSRLKLVAFNTENDFSHALMICEIKANQ
jgi:uncharacterized SAM-dependent methyltransferase